MKLFISDLHIGSPLFKEEGKLVELFNDPEVEEIFILGDVIDAWYGNIHTIVKSNISLINAINSCDKIKVILKGNHDPDIETMKNIFYNCPITEEYEIELFGKRTILIHGDKFDPRAYDNNIYFSIHKFLAKYDINIKAFVRNIVYNFIRIKNGLEKNDIVVKEESDIYNKYYKDYDIIIAGHTHLPKMARCPKADYLNCGSIVYKPTYIAISKNTMSLKRL